MPVHMKTNKQQKNCQNEASEAPSGFCNINRLSCLVVSGTMGRGSSPTFKPHHGGGTPPELKTGDITKWGYRQATDKRRPRACSIFRDLKPGAISSPIDVLLKNQKKAPKFARRNVSVFILGGSPPKNKDPPRNSRP